MVSNGYFVDLEYVNQLKSAGLNMIQVSIDGHTQSTHDNFRQIKGSYNKAISAIEHCVSAGLEVSVSSIPHILNFKYFKEIIKKCYELGVKSHRSMPFIPMGRGEFANKWILDSNQYAEFVSQYYSLKNEYEDKGLKLIWGDPMDHLIRMPMTAEEDIATYQLSIKSNGEVLVSPYVDFIVGDLKIHSLNSIWDKVYSDIWKNPIWIDYISCIESLDDFAKCTRFIYKY